jgi:hypothetical protein
LVGFSPDHDYRYLEINRELRRRHPAAIAEAMAGIEKAGGWAQQDPENDLLTINREFTASLVIMRCFQTFAGGSRWKLRLNTDLNPDLIIAIRMDRANEAAQDYYLLPMLDMRSAVLRLCEYNGLTLDAYRFDRLDALFEMAARVQLRRAA